MAFRSKNRNRPTLQALVVRLHLLLNGEQPKIVATQLPRDLGNAKKQRAVTLGRLTR